MRTDPVNAIKVTAWWAAIVSLVCLTAALLLSACSPLQPTRYTVTYTVNVVGDGSAKVEAAGVETFVAHGFWTATVETAEVPALTVTPVTGCAVWFSKMGSGPQVGSLGCAK